MLPLAISHTLPLTDPVLKFLIILVIIIAAPLLLNKLKIPHLLGLIIAGAIIGPYGLNLILRDSSIILSGTAGLLYIMFLAGLEIDMGDFKKNSGRSFVFGMYTFLIPMGLGIIAGYYLLHFSMDTSILLASMFASHTLIAYPIISKLGIAKDKSVTITVGGTMITDMLALLVLTVIVGMATGQIGKHFWTQLSISVHHSAISLTQSLVFQKSTRQYFPICFCIDYGIPGSLSGRTGRHRIHYRFLSGRSFPEPPDSPFFSPHAPGRIYRECHFHPFLFNQRRNAD